LREFVLSRLRVRRPIKILELVNPQLRQVIIPGLAESLAEGELIHTRAAEYPATRAWARYFHHSLPHLEGLAWRPRLGGEGLAYVFFGDRVAPTDFELVERASPIDTGPGRKLIDVIAGEAHIRIIAMR
jgi:RES domain